MSKGNVSGAVKRLKVSGEPIPLKFIPSPSGETYYAKLRPEVDKALYNSGSGQMYIGLHLDPIYKVYWNNFAKPVVYELTLPSGVKASPLTAKGLLPDVEADKDPREFLVDISNWTDKSKPLDISVFYIACNKEHGWYKPVTQKYTVNLERDGFTGSAYTRRKPPGRKPKRK